MTINPQDNQFESLMRASRDAFSLTPRESHILSSQFNAKLTAHKLNQYRRITSPFAFFLNQKVIAAAFSVLVITSGLFLNYFSAIDTASQYQNTVLQNNIAVLVKNPLAFTPEMQSSLLSAHTAYANSIEEQAITNPEETLVSNTAVLGLYESALSMLSIHQSRNYELINFMQTLLSDAIKRNHEYEEQLAIATITQSKRATHDYSQIITAIKRTVQESQAILKEHPELATPENIQKIQSINQQLEGLHDGNLQEIKIILKQSADTYEFLALASVI